MSYTNQQGITNLKEAGIAVASLIKAFVSANADGKISLAEWVGLGIGNAARTIDALKDAHQIFPEVLDLQPYEFEEFYFSVLEVLVLEDSGTSRRRIGAVYELILQGLICARQWQDEVSGMEGADHLVLKAEVVVDKSTLAEGETPPLPDAPPATPPTTRRKKS